MLALGGDRMSQYTTNTSDKSRRTAIILLLCGGVGLHRLYVGRIKSGIIRLIVGFFTWCFLFASASDAEIGAAGIVTSVVILAVLNVPDLLALLFGSFRDNVGAPLRE